jgi:hypothetical protein
VHAYSLSLHGLECNSTYIQTHTCTQPCLSLKLALITKPKLLTELVFNSYQLLPADEQPPLLLVLPQLVPPLVEDPQDLQIVILWTKVLQVPVLQTVTKVLQMMVLTGMAPQMIPQVTTPATLAIPHPIMIQMMMVTMVHLKMTIPHETHKLTWLMPFWL